MSELHPQVAAMLQQWDWPLLLVVAAVVLAAAFISGATGFGFASFSVPLLTVVLNPRSAIVLAVILGGMTVFWVGWHHRRHIDRTLLVGWLLGGLLGVPLGLMVFIRLNDKLLQALITIGIVVVLATRQVRSPEPSTVNVSMRGSVVSGIPAGIMAATSSLQGPAVALYSTWIGLRKDPMQATMAAFGALISISVMIGFLFTGQISESIGELVIFCVPILTLGVWLGLRVNSRMSDRHFAYTIQILLIVMSILMVTNLFLDLNS